MEDIKNIPKDKVSESVSFFSLYRYADTKDKIILGLGTICAIANGTVLPLMTITFGSIFSEFYKYAVSTKDKIAQETFKTAVLDLILWLTLLGVITLVLSYFMMGFFMWSGERQVKKIRINYFHALMQKNMAWYDQHYSKKVDSQGDNTDEAMTALSERVSNDTLLIQDGISEKAGLVIQFLVTFLAGFVIAFVKCWQLALVLTATLPLIAISGMLMTKAVAKVSEQGQTGYAIAGSHALEILSNVRTVFAFHAQEQEKARYENKILEGRKSNEKIALFSGFGMGTVMLLIFCTYGLGFWFGSMLIAWGTIPTNEKGLVLNVFFSMICGAMSLGTASPHLVSMTTARGAAKKIFDIIDSVDRSSESFKTDSDVSEDFESIVLDNVNFSYPTRQDVHILHNCSVEIPRGSTVAFVGKSGCGKSTIFRLLLDLYKPTNGELYCKAMSSENCRVPWSKAWIKKHVAMVGQEPVLFDLTIAENIALGALEYLPQDHTSTPNMLSKDMMMRVEEAARLANAHEFITKSLPEGYQTRIGESGSCLLSGGQKQRIAIARALIKDPSILLLDEATSALDTESEQAVQEAIQGAMKGRTTCVIAHRLSTIKNADKICVLDKGIIIQCGTHSELLKDYNGVYYELVNAQSIKITDSPMTEDEKREAKTISVGNEEIINLQSNPEKFQDEKYTQDRSASTPKSNWSMLKLIRTTFHWNRPELGIMIGGGIAALVNGSVMPLFSFIFAELNNVYAQQDISTMRSEANLYSGLFAVLGLVCFVCHVFQLGLFGISGERLTARLRVAVFSVILSQPISWFDDIVNNGAGLLHTRLSNDAEQVKGMMGQLFGSVLQAIVTMVAGLSIALATGWELSLVVLATIPAMIICGALQAKILGGYGHKTRKAYEKSGKIASESISNIRTIVSLGREDYFESYFKSSLDAPYKIGVKRAWTAGIGFGFSQASMFFSYGMAYWYGSGLILDGKYTFEQMNRVIFVMIFCAFAAGQISSFAPNYAKARIAAIAIYEMLGKSKRHESLKAIHINDQVKPAASNDHSIVLSNVTFSYPTRREVYALKNVSITAPSGKVAALVGPSGSGKSSIFGLIEGLYEADLGQLIVCGKDMNEWKSTDDSMGELRSKIGWVGQEPILFSRSIAENIAFGMSFDPKTPFSFENLSSELQDAMEKATKLANVHDLIISLPEGYNTLVGDKGSMLSVGQKQRIAIARALLRSPDILLLDEATSALDTESEKLVKEALDQAQKGRTTLIIAHRLSTIQHADIIYVLDHGKIIEQGTHEELLAKGRDSPLSSGSEGLSEVTSYASMVSKQNLH
jgi:ABC-type multidrug transport system fused ATPase/permease subunit